MRGREGTGTIIHYPIIEKLAGIMHRFLSRSDESDDPTSATLAGRMLSALQ